VKISVLILSSLILSGCAVVADYPLTAVSLGVWGVTGKSPADHALSYATSKDCNTLNILKNKGVCQQDKSTKTDKTTVKTTENPKKPNKKHAVDPDIARMEEAMQARINQDQ